MTTVSDIYIIIAEYTFSCRRSPHTADVTIGFRPVDYTVSEDAGTVTLIVQLIDGELARPVQVDLTTVDGTATSTAPADFVAPGLPIILEFTPDQSQQEVQITINDDVIVENTERFAAILSTVDQAVILDPERATVEITDATGGKSYFIKDTVQFILWQ